MASYGKGRKFILIFAAIALLIFFNFHGWLESPKSIIYKIFSPFQKISLTISHQLANFFTLFFRAKSLIEENQRLQEENFKLLGEVSRLAALERENEFLQKELGLKKEANFEFILADVVGSDIQNYNHLIFINKGAAHGVKTGQAVVLAGRILVGAVKEVYRNNSKIETIFNFSGRFNVVTEKSRINGVIIAQNSEIFMDLIDSQKQVVVGEKVLTSGTAGIFPKGLLVGEIAELIEKDNQIFKQARLSVPYNLKEIDQVLIIK